ncbi:MAG: hypothetical protein ACKOCD_00350 [Nitrospiraceae bacterium]
MNISILDPSYAAQLFLQDTMGNTQDQTTTPTDVGSLLSALEQTPAATGNGSGSASDSVSISLEAQLLQETSANAANPLLAALTAASSSNGDTVPSALSLDQQLAPALPPDLLAALEQKFQSAQTQEQAASTTASNPSQSVNTIV